MGRYQDVAEEAQVLLAHLNTLPAEPGEDETSMPWNVRETVLDISRGAALDLGEWQQALDLNQDILSSARARGAGVHELAWTRFNDHGPLLDLGRSSEAERLLLDCQQVFTDTVDIDGLSAVFSARAALEQRRGRTGEAVIFEHQALRYSYQRPQLDDLAVSHHNLANYLATIGQDPAAVLAHRLAAALLYRVTGRVAGLADAMHALAVDLRRYPDTASPDLPTLVTTVEQVPGVRFGAVLTALVPDPGAQQAMRDEILRAARNGEA